MPMVWQARSTRSAISPRFAMRTLSSTGIGNRECGIGKAASRSLLTSGFIQCIHQRRELGEYAVDQFNNFGRFLREFQTHGDLVLGVEFRKRTTGHGKEAQIFRIERRAAPSAILDGTLTAARRTREVKPNRRVGKECRARVAADHSRKT